MYSFKNHLSDLLNQPVISIKPVSGGDISSAYKIETIKQSYFLKVNTGKLAFKMFQTEKMGLETLRRTKTISIPEVYSCDIYDNTAFLLMEYVESKSPSEEDHYHLGKKLAELHQLSNDTFGLDHNNFIGSLPQSNKQHRSWTDFYIHERLLPQFHVATNSGHLYQNEAPNENLLTEKLSFYFQNIKPSLLHGDLWSGNFLIATDGTPYLIDPAIYFGHYEMDLAMSKLFGGFGDAFYKAHSEHYPQGEFFNARMELYQLYYLLVHLNLFGRSYYGSVKHIIDKYF